MGIINLRLKPTIKSPDGITKASKCLTLQCHSQSYCNCPLALFECPFKLMIKGKVRGCSEITEEDWIRFLEYMRDEAPRDLSDNTLTRGDKVIVLDQNEDAGLFGVYEFTNYQSCSPHRITLTNGESRSFRRCKKINERELNEMKSLLKDSD